MKSKHLLPILILLGGGMFFYLQSGPIKTTDVAFKSKKPVNNIKRSVSGSVKESKLQKKEVPESIKLKPQVSNPLGLSLKEDKESHKEHIKTINKLATDLPANKGKLMEFIKLESKYKDVEAKPHTIDEILKRQEGTLKVFALRHIMKKTPKAELLNDLDQLASEAKDPTIVNIAKEAKKSVEQNRSFFEDFKAAVAEIPLED